jgi:hypothetical protein
VTRFVFRRLASKLLPSTTTASSAACTN